ncbi:MAG: DEAD/DEAH box helicase family protein [Synergistaceae bacterium]|nr:DEAD/DEAH box helicase family protein [Synergistaceae bacterium]
MNNTKITKLIINSAYSEPRYHWQYNRQKKSFDMIEGRRLAGYLVTSKNISPQDDDEGKFIEIKLVNEIRPKVQAWREADYPGITNTTRRLLEYWHDESARFWPFFFCQLDAIESLIFLTEAPDNLKTGIKIVNDGSKFRRICTKLCTGGGKTIVMAMLISWMICNKINYPRDKRFSKNILVIAPNLTVKERLQVLRPEHPKNYYSQFEIVPAEMRDLLARGKIIIHNWQALAWETQEQIAKHKSVDKRGPKSDNAYVREILNEFPSAKNILVINDEAHHAWRVRPEDKKGYKRSAEEKAAYEEATVWINGLDRINKARGILTCYDFSATPFIPGKTRNDEEGLFSWIVSDFGLSDGIESGIVKTPRVVVRDDALPDKNYRSKLLHIYADKKVKPDLTSSPGDEAELPELVRNAYLLLGKDWAKTFEVWKSSGKLTPPVMITVANTTATAARIDYSFTHGKIDVPELCEPDKILRIDSRILDDKNTSDAKLLREVADTIGQEGRKGEQIRNVISVGMLSEGWDAKTVTHIMGLRAFTSQLLCEQVVGRGLRRTSYDKPKDGEFFTPEYVNVFGIPFTFLPHEDTGTGEIIPAAPKTLIQVLDERLKYKISWPNLTNLEYLILQKLSLNVESVPELELNAEGTTINVELAPIINGKTDLMRCDEIDIEKLYANIRLQQIIFKTAGEVYDKTQTEWQKRGVKLTLLGQVIKLSENYLQGGHIKIFPELFAINEVRRKILLALNMEKIINHLWNYITSESRDVIRPVFNSMKRIMSTEEMHSWYTGRSNEITRKSHVNRCVFDSRWEASEAYKLDHNPNVKAWVKNDHLGFYVSYVFKGAERRYLPDFLIKLENDRMLILEVKGLESEQDKIKRERLSDWVKAVNGIKIFGEWACDISKSPADIDEIIAKYI